MTGSWYGSVFNSLIWVPVVRNMNSCDVCEHPGQCYPPNSMVKYREGPLLIQLDNGPFHATRLAQTWCDKMGSQKQALTFSEILSKSHKIPFE
ncbi:hypothetical protein TNCV_3372991 [Trichonephila clavipes]|nr:hypothetical protein TNCV_3372991 [Trichonephila clavipes]